MKADWIIRIEMARFFENHAELRVRTDQGLVEDTILRGVFHRTLLKDFTQAEIHKAVKLGYIVKKSIMVSGSHRTVYGWTEKPCVYQPVWYKRWYVKVKSFMAEKLTS